jgi:P2-related tail formation protein
LQHKFIPRQKAAGTSKTDKANTKASFQKAVQNLEKLEKIMDWKQKGLITDEEFQKLKFQVLENQISSHDPINTNVESSDIIHQTSTYDEQQSNNVEPSDTDYACSKSISYVLKKMTIYAYANKQISHLRSSIKESTHYCCR